LPVYLFALSLTPTINWIDALFVFVILHFLVYPASNGYNSYMDRDTTPIGGVEKPMQPTKQLFIITIVMDVIAVALSLFISIYFAIGVLAYILASRAYSYRGIRLKKYPVLGYLIVIFFQGWVTFFLAYHGCSADKTLHVPAAGMLTAACLIGGYYPLTQIYQHKEDKNDGVITISYLLGKKGTFAFCGFVFGMATLSMFLLYKPTGNLQPFWLFVICMLPMVWFFLNWMRQVWRDESKADFRNSFLMNILAAACTTICFTILIIKNNI
jgi:1,4-dihydroxy-2-naphthoate octaprenyltransferase